MEYVYTDPTSSLDPPSWRVSCEKATVKEGNELNAIDVLRDGPLLKLRPHMRGVGVAVHSPPTFPSTIAASECSFLVLIVRHQKCRDC